MKREFEFIDWLRTQVTNSQDNLVTGIGDDAAIFQVGENRELLVTTDLLVEDIHFKLDYTQPSLLGRKALAVNLSDIAAMGGRTKYFLLGIARPRDLSDELLESIVKGMLSLAGERGISLIGGDTSSARDRLTISITAIGECKRGQAIRRSTARPGDHIYVTGLLGGAALGLEMLQKGKRLKDARHEIGDTGALREYLADTVALRAHLAPEPRLALGAIIGERQLATAMIDISDGLSSDLEHICKESKVGAEIESSQIPLLEGATLEQALNGGEDYELLFTIAPTQAEELQKLCSEFSATNITRIGTITTARELFINLDGKVQLLTPHGYDHFRSDR